MALIPILVCCLVLSVTFLLRAEFKKISKQIYFFKPLSTILIIAIIVLSYFVNSTDYLYKSVILIGMLLCLGGDIALMFDSARAFMVGLVLFLLGHIAYTAAILQFGGLMVFDMIATPIIVLVSLVVFYVVYPGLGKMKIPAGLYMLIITVMVNCAILTIGAEAFSPAHSWYLAIGAVLFYISDVMLAINKFRFPFKLNRISLAFYFSGQLLIALSSHHTIIA